MFAPHGLLRKHRHAIVGVLLAMLALSNAGRAQTHSPVHRIRQHPSFIPAHLRTGSRTESTAESRAIRHASQAPRQIESREPAPTVPATSFADNPSTEFEQGLKLAQYITTEREKAGSTSVDDDVALAGALSSAVQHSHDAQVFTKGGPLACGPSGCAAGCLQTCCHGLWVRGEYLLWWTDAMDLPPLVTTSPPGTAPNISGVLGQPGTQVLLGNGGFGGPVQSGARVSFGWWIDPSQCRGLEASYFGLASRTSSFAASSGVTPILARPVFDTGTNSEAAMLVAHPDFLVGSIGVDASTELQGAEALYRRRVCEGLDSRLDLLIGYRFARLDETLRVNQSSEWTAAQGNIVVGTTQELFDLFTTDNQFQGGEIGLAYQKALRCWSLDVLMKLGLGNNHAEVLIDGQTVNTVPGGGSATFVGGLLAQETNIGSYERDTFGLLPELGVTLRRDLGCNLHLSIGYTLLYWTSTVRPGEQIDRDVSQFPPEAPTGTRQPAFNFRDGTFATQGLRLGLEYRF